MSVFVIGDPHLSLGSDKPMNIFGGWDDYVGRLESAWRAAVRPCDTVVIPGDVSWAMTLDEAKKDFDFLQSLPGTKYLMKGNHDYWWQTASKMTAFFTQNGYGSIKFIHNNAAEADGIALCGTRGWFYDLDDGDDKKVLLREQGRLRASLEAAVKTGLEPVVFLHYPPLYGDYRCGEIMEVLTSFPVKRCFYGHLHAQSHFRAVEGVHEGIDFRLVSADRLRFVPYLVTR